ncbi:MAG: cation:dicarboxylate symporter family transporter [Anaplasma sp.]
MVIGQLLKLLLLLLVLVGAFCFADLVPYAAKSFCYAVSLSIKEVLVFILPFVVFSIVFHSTSQLRGGSAIKTMSLLIIMVMLSNSLSVGISYALGSYLASKAAHTVVSEVPASQVLEPMFRTFQFPSLISSAKALFMGFLCGIVLPPLVGKRAANASKKLSNASVFVLDKVFAPILPIFILGFTFKMESDGALHALRSNAEVMVYIFVSAFSYIVFLYWVGNSCSLRRTLDSIRVMIPAVLTGFSTMSSLLTMPTTLAAVKKNTDDSNVVDISVPGSVNVHLVGDCFFSVILWSLLATTFGTEATITASDQIHFLVYVVLMKFAEAAVAGTGLVLMFPIIEQYLHFSPAMLSLSTTLFILLDPLITATNVFGNGAFSILFVRIHKLLFGREMKSKEA